MTLQQLHDPEEEAAKALLGEARSLLQKDEERKFFDALFSGAASEDITRFNAAGLAALAAMGWGEARQHRRGEVELQLLAGSDAQDPETVVVAVNDDRPFLFDTALAAAIAGGARIRAAFHPIVEVPGPDGKGRPTSVIVLVADRVLGEAAEDRLRDSLASSFIQGRDAVRDWKKMLARLREARAQLAANPPKGADIEEALAFLDWLGDNYFTFLGARDYALHQEDEYGRLDPVPESGLGALSDEEARVIRQTAERPALTAGVRSYLDRPEPLIVTKSNARSLVHRRAHMDYVGVKTFDETGRFTGERRFVGLFTSSAYALSPSEIPLLRTECKRVMARAGFQPMSHDGKALAHILQTFPRDELFQISEDELFETAMGILRLGGRPKVKLFLRFDRFDRFVSALLFAPRDRVNAEQREKIHALLARAFDGRKSAAIPAIDEESALVRIHYIIGRNTGARPKPDVRALEQEIADAIKTWDDAFLEALSARHGRAHGLSRMQARQAQFSAGYRGMFSPAEAAQDLEILESLAAGPQGLKVKARAYREACDASSALRLKLYVLGEVLPLSVSLPIFENLGLKVIAEDAYPLRFRRDDGWTEESAVLDFRMERADGKPALLGDMAAPLEDVFHAVVGGLAESDGFNRLVMAANLRWRDVAILRMVAKFLRQAAFPFSQDYMEQALCRNPEIAALLTQMFHARLDPKSHSEGEAGRLSEAIEVQLANVPSLDDDRIIRRFRNVIAHVLRTNYYREGADAIAIKLDSAKLDELPAPRPWREIFVYSPKMEGVHLRFGPVARGGIRWSDRREDFRTEILGLVKAQQVKNAVIVPVGAKGGFYPKAMPDNPSRDQAMAAGVAAYKTLIHALLDLTDNLKPTGEVAHPVDVVRRDADDPYLVVAADKGTATFSDIANGVAEERGFWLGDAFASGGSHGYDHKKMGITAKGAWEAVKRHFRELGRDIQNEDFTVIGVGDMSGDVFGNGMLLSEHIRLTAAFDHRHIFLDPEADAAKGFKERTRLFELPRSSWDDYDRQMLGPGGGIFARSLKEIVLSREVQILLGVKQAKLSPPSLIKALLKAKADLIWFGGIGTFIKASSQSNLDCGDRANDAVRVNGSEVAAKAIGEGANLGVTQLGRVEYARAGGRIDTDAVDNSAGVDTSDHEVNLKILLSGPYRRGEIDGKSRDGLLAAMTGDVAALVLADNYDQTLALSVAEAAGPRDIDAGARFIRALEAKGRLDRAVEFLPGDSEIKKLENDNKGFTRPELAVLMAYAKLDLDAEILASRLPDDPAFAATLAAYFPRAAAEKFAAELGQHRLKREIVSTAIANRIVNLAGPVFVARMKEMSGASGADVARAFWVAEGAFGLEALKRRIDALDGKTEAGVQIGLYAEIAEILRRLGLWFLRHVTAREDLGGEIALYRAGTEALRAQHRNFISAEQAAEVDARLARFSVKGVPLDLARDIALLPLLGVAPEIAQLARATSHSVASVAALYFGAGAALGLDRLRELAGRIGAPEHWDRLAIRRLVDDLFAAQRALSQRLLGDLPEDGGPQEALRALSDWVERQNDAVERSRSFLSALETSGEMTIGKLTLANSQIHTLANI